MNYKLHYGAKKCLLKICHTYKFNTSFRTIMMFPFVLYFYNIIKCICMYRYSPAFMWKTIKNNKLSVLHCGPKSKKYYLHANVWNMQNRYNIYNFFKKPPLLLRGLLLILVTRLDVARQNIVNSHDKIWWGCCLPTFLA